MPKYVDRVAEAIEHMALGTANGPTYFAPFSLVASAACTIALVEGPPVPTIKPVLILLISSGNKPESAIACSVAI